MQQVVYVFPRLLASEKESHESVCMCSSEFIREVRHLDERRYLLIHLSGFYEHEKHFAADQTEAGLHAVTKPGNVELI